MTSDAARAPLTGDLRFWEQLTPSPPTTEREFSSKDEVTAFAEIYTNGQKAGERLDITTTVENARGTVFFTHGKRNRSMRRRESRRPIATSHRFTFRPSHPAATS